jgi:Uma2 family endonuclease
MTILDEELLVRRRRFTVDEYYRMAEVGVLHEDDRVELIDGEVISMSPIGKRHGAAVDRLNELLILRLARRATVKIQNPLRIDQHSEPQPDIVVARRREDFYAAEHPRPEDTHLVIEVGDSSARFDRVVKAPIYARSGVPEVWLVDLVAGEVRVLRAPGPDGYADVSVKRRGETISPGAFPDLVLRAEDVLGQTD